MTARDRAQGLRTKVVGLTGGSVIIKISGLALQSTNRKTGPMVQTYAYPESWAGQGMLLDSDESEICNGCPMRANVTQTSR